jgi:methylated-DNA-[protein]-cysteine S-methyltransferase
MITLDVARISTPIGPLLLFARGDALVGLEFASETNRAHFLRARFERHLGAYETREVADPAGAATRLAAYFAGDRRALEGQKVELLGTPFELAVWNELRRIPAGKTISYTELATRVGRPNGPRAVGQANGRNPVAVVVPCHRVIAAAGTLGGYGGGLDRKRTLLTLEGALEPELV